jgi:hypothetical protein
VEAAADRCSGRFASDFDAASVQVFPNARYEHPLKRTGARSIQLLMPF